MKHKLFKKWIEFDYDKSDLDFGACGDKHAYYYLLSCSSNNKLKAFVATHEKHNNLSVRYREGFVDQKQLRETLKNFTILHDTKVKQKLNRIVVKYILNKNLEHL